MELLYLVGTIWSILLVTFAMCLDTSRPMSTKLKYKYRVKDDSIFRKIIKLLSKTLSSFFHAQSIGSPLWEPFYGRVQRKITGSPQTAG